MKPNWRDKLLGLASWCAIRLHRRKEILATAAVLIGLIVLLWLLPESLFPVPDGLTPGKRIEFENDIRKTWSPILGGFLVLLGLYLTYRRIEVTEEGQITERFTRAIDQLGAVHEGGEPHLEIRLGGIYALERIANDSRKDYWIIMEVLTAYVRENATTDQTKGSKCTAYRPRIDIQAILTVLGRRRKEYEKGLDEHLDLTRSHLRRADMFEADLEAANFAHANLDHAIMIYSNLKGTNFYKAYARSVVCEHANLQDASFRETHLEGAILRDCNLQGVCFTGAHLNGADLMYSVGLTLEQLRDAHMDESTRLPEYLMP